MPEQLEVDECWAECYVKYEGNAKLLDDALDAWYIITAAKREALRRTRLRLVSVLHISKPSGTG